MCFKAIPNAIKLKVTSGIKNTLQKEYSKAWASKRSVENLKVYYRVLAFFFLPFLGHCISIFWLCP